jgi:hypothetical protein
MDPAAASKQHVLVRRAVLAILAALVAAGCSSPPPPIVARGSEVLSVMWADNTLTASTVGATCRLGGTSPVQVPWWRISRDAHLAPAGVLRTGDSLVQGYRVVSGNNCLVAGGQGGALLGVRVEGHPYTLGLPAQQVHEITDCLSVVEEPPTIRRAS